MIFETATTQTMSSKPKKHYGKWVKENYNGLEDEIDQVDERYVFKTTDTPLMRAMKYASHAIDRSGEKIGVLKTTDESDSSTLYIALFFVSALFLSCIYSPSPPPLTPPTDSQTDFHAPEFPILCGFVSLAIIAFYLVIPFPSEGRTFYSFAEKSFTKTVDEMFQKLDEAKLNSLQSQFGGLSLANVFISLFFLSYIGDFYAYASFAAILSSIIVLPLMIAWIQFFARFILTLKKTNAPIMLTSFSPPPWGFVLFLFNIALFCICITTFLTYMFQGMNSAGWFLLALVIMIGFLFTLVREKHWNNQVRIFGSVLWVTAYTMFLYVLYYHSPLLLNVFKLVPASSRQTVYDYLFFPVTFLYALRLFLYSFLDRPQFEPFTKTTSTSGDSGTSLSKSNPQISYNDVRVKYLILFLVFLVFVRIYMVNPSRIPCYLQNLAHTLFGANTHVQYSGLVMVVLTCFVFLCLVLLNPNIVNKDASVAAAAAAAAKKSRRGTDPVIDTETDTTAKSKAEAARKMTELNPRKTKDSLFQGFKTSSTIGVVCFVLFVCAFLYNHYRFLANERDNAASASASSSLTLITNNDISWGFFFLICTAWSILFLYKLFRSDKALDELVTEGTFTRLMTYRVAVFAVFVALLWYLHSWIKTSVMAPTSQTAFSYYLNLALILCFTAILVQILLNTDYVNKNVYARLFIQCIFLLPCLVLWALTATYTSANAGADAVEFTRYTIFYALGAVVAALLLIQIVVPKLTDYIRGGTVLRMRPEPLFQSLAVSSITFLDSNNALLQQMNLPSTANRSLSVSFRYAVSFWVYLEVQPAVRDHEFVVVNVAGIPKIVFNPQTNTLTVKSYFPCRDSTTTNTCQVKTPDGKQFSDKIDANGYRELCRLEDFPLQRWNNVVFNADSGTADIFLNGQLIKSVQNVLVEYAPDTSVIIGERSGLAGSVCNFVYYSEPLEISKIASAYNWLENQSPPIAISETLEFGSEMLDKDLAKAEAKVMSGVNTLVKDLTCDQVSLDKLESDLEDVNAAIPTDISIGDILSAYSPWHFSNYLSYEWYEKAKAMPTDVLERRVTDKE